MFDQQGFFCPLSKIGISYKVKNGGLGLRFSFPGLNLPLRFLGGWDLDLTVLLLEIGDAPANQIQNLSVC